MTAASLLNAAAVWEWLQQPFEYGFMRSALLAALLLGAVSGVTSTFTVVRGTALFADALAHAVLPGVAVAYLVWGTGGGPLFWGALVAAWLASLAVHAIAGQAKVREETAIGVVMAAALALGVAIISVRRAYAVDLSHVLFGDILGVGEDDLVRTAALAAVVVGAALVLWRPFAIVSFDPVLAATLRLPVGWLQYGFLSLIALTTVLALQAVGATMTLALVVTPGAAARMVARSLSGMAVVSVGVALVAAVAGLYVSYYLSVPSGPAIVLVLTALFGVFRVFARR